MYSARFKNYYLIFFITNIKSQITFLLTYYRILLKMDVKMLLQSDVQITVILILFVINVSVLWEYFYLWKSQILC